MEAILTKNDNSKELLTGHAWLEKMCQGCLNENGNFKKREPIMHSYRSSLGGDINENDTLKMWKLILHGYKKMHGAILAKMKIIKRDKK